VLQGNCHNLKNFEKLGCELRVAAIGNVAGVTVVAVVAVVANVGNEAGVIREMGQLPSINVGNDRMVGVGLAPTPRYCGVRVRVAGSGVRVAGVGVRVAGVGVRVAGSGCGGRGSGRGSGCGFGLRVAVVGDVAGVTVVTKSELPPPSLPFNFPCTRSASLNDRLRPRPY
jgi:hypothetical protein